MKAKSTSSYIIIALIALHFCSFIALANIKLPAVFQSSMVLQRDTKAPLWGSAEPNSTVSITVSLNDKTTKYTASADSNGKWLTKIGPFSAGGPCKISISEPNSSVTLENALFGDVWLCSGQSNMDMSLEPSARGKVLNYESVIASANYPEIRFITIAPIQWDYNIPQTDCKGDWQVCSPNTVGTFSAVAYYFARRVQEDVNVPIGLISAATGGSMIESWFSPDMVEKNPNVFDFQKKFCLAIAEKYDQWTKNHKEGENAPRKPTPKFCLAAMYNLKIAPIAGFAIKGVLWYQGENNVFPLADDTPPPQSSYKAVFPMLISCWRQIFHQPDLPLYFVQIPAYQYKIDKPAISDTAAAIIREAQLAAMHKVKNTGMAVTIDLGEPNALHPSNKQPVGERLALWALTKTYGVKGLAYSGPIYKSMCFENDKIRIFFDFANKGLVAQNGPLTSFQIAGPDKIFYDADAVIDYDAVVVSSPNVRNPQAVRFAFSNAPTPNLFNKAGLPASPFRTDNWPLSNPPEQKQ